MKKMLPLAAMLLLQFSCANETTGPEPHRFDIVMRYGVLAKNALNTIDNTVTKDLIIDGTVTAPLFLTPADFDSIERWLTEVDIMSYPDTFVTPRADSTAVVTTLIPFESYMLELHRDGRAKKVIWHDSTIPRGVKAETLRFFFSRVRELVEFKPAYRRLPPARGGYI
jgi:hypothetical protein